MNRFKNHLIAAAVLSVLAIIGTTTNSHQAAAQGPPGGLAVTATQSGAWNVGINGTPSVKVTNPATAPALYVNVNDPGRMAYQHSITGSCFSEQCGGSAGGAVPTGHRLVIQHISVNGVATPSTTVAEMEVSALFQNGQSGPVITSFPANVSALGILGTLVTVDQPVLVFMDQGQQPSFFIRANNSLNGNLTVNITGYLVDCTIAPCVAITP